MNIHDLKDAQVRFENHIADVKKSRENLYKVRSSFVSYFNIKRIENMQIDEFAIGVDLPKNGFNFCYALERQLDGLGRTIGSNAFKFGVYYGVTKNDKVKKYRFTKKFGDSYKDAFKNVKASIIQLIIDGSKQDLKAISENLLSPMFKGKILSTYYPDYYLNVFSPDHLNYYLTKLDIDSKELILGDAVFKRMALQKFKNHDKVMRNWSVDLFSYFLYTEYPGSPPKEDEIDKRNDALADYRQPIFPSIQYADFINLNISSSDSTKVITDIHSPIKQSKPDYERETKKNKELGDRGEKIVMDLEENRLISEGRTDLAKKITRVSLKTDSLGYDILSFDNEGNERFIEVKATSQKVGNVNFFLSSNELNKAQELENYFIYMVYDVISTNPKVWVIGNPFNPENPKIIRTPVNYRVTIKVEKF